jgi:hypothetical protein
MDASLRSKGQRESTATCFTDGTRHDQQRDARVAPPPKPLES